MYDEALQFLDAAMQNISNDGDSIGHNMLRLLNDRGDIYMRMGEYERAAECYSRTSAIADTLSVHSLSNLTVEVQKVIDSERTIAKHREWQIIIIAGIIILVVFILLMLRQNLIVRRKNKRMMALIRQLTSYREAIIQNGDSDEMGENLVSGVSAEEYKRFKEVDKRIMKEQLFSNPDFGRDDLMRLLGVDKNTLPSLINSITGTNVPGYINSKRMEYAVTLVKMHPEYTLGAIAEACGIKSPATFIRNFKAAYDMTPSEYRKQLENGFTAPPQY
jgi:AraC-like DNA-binding protein